MKKKIRKKKKLIKLGLYNNLGFKKYSFSNNNKSIEKLNLSINNQKEKKELIIPIIDKKNINSIIINNIFRQFE